MRKGDVIGIRLDTIEGIVSFDLNGFDYGEAYKSDELKEGIWHITIDLGTSEDKVSVFDPP